MFKKKNCNGIYNQVSLPSYSFSLFFTAIPCFCIQRTMFHYFSSLRFLSRVSVYVRYWDIFRGVGVPLKNISFCPIFPKNCKVQFLSIKISQFCGKVANPYGPCRVCARSGPGPMGAAGPAYHCPVLYMQIKSLFTTHLSTLLYSGTCKKI